MVALAIIFKSPPSAGYHPESLTLTHWQTLVGGDISVGYANRSVPGPDADPFCPERWLEEQASETQVE